MITDIKKKEILTALFADVFPYYSIHLFTQRLFFYLYVLHSINYSPLYVLFLFQCFMKQLLFMLTAAV